jgi:hypothetical protein
MGVRAEEDFEAVTHLLCDLRWVRPLSESEDAKRSSGDIDVSESAMEPKVAGYHMPIPVGE